MKIFQTGFHEVVRKALRLRDRLRLFVEKRKLGRAETALGLLGWQQADFYSPELTEQITRIHDAQKAQTNLMNERAGLSDTIRELKTELESSGRAFSAQLTGMEAEQDSLNSKLHEMSSQIAEKQKIIARFKAGIQQLQKQEMDLSTVYHKLSIEPHSAIVSAELVRNREMRVKTQDEMQELQVSCARLEVELGKLNKDIVPLNLELSRNAGRMKAVKEESSANEHRLVSRIREVERAMEKIGKQITSLDQNKEGPYQLLGQSLANENISPMNQPEALEKVHALRLSIEQIESGIAQSIILTAQANRRELLIFYALVCVALVALALVVRFWVNRG